MQDDKGTPTKAPWSRPVIVRLDTHQETEGGPHPGYDETLFPTTYGSLYYYPFS